MYEENAPHIDAAIFNLGLPVLGVCYGMQETAWHFGKNVLAGEKREYGHAIVNVIRREGRAAHIDCLLQGLGDRLEVFMSHGDKLSQIPESFSIIASTSSAPFAGIAHNDKPVYGVQFHPEVTHTPQGVEILTSFAVNICQAQRKWTMEEFATKEVERIRSLVGRKAQVIGGQ